MKISASKEDYLKTILLLHEKEAVRSVDIARALGVSKASVSRMLSLLKREGYVVKENYGPVLLTGKGFEVGSGINRKYELLRLFLMRVLKLDGALAAKEACRIEHLLSDETLNKVSGYVCRRNLMGGE